MVIYVNNFPNRISEEQLRKVFESIGKVRKVRIISDQISGRSLGFGFVEMPVNHEAQEAINQLQHTRIGGRVVMVCQGLERKERRMEQWGA